MVELRTIEDTQNPGTNTPHSIKTNRKKPNISVYFTSNFSPSSANGKRNNTFYKCMNYRCRQQHDLYRNIKIWEIRVHAFTS